MSDTPDRKLYWLIIGHMVNGMGMDLEAHHCYGPCSLAQARKQFIAAMQNGYDDVQIIITNCFRSESPISRPPS
jgi:hypothetical protein